jgi:glycosyltransferase involved in cell wall biosynthesis
VQRAPSPRDPPSASPARLRVSVLVPEVLPSWLKNSDIHQNRTLLQLGAHTGGRLSMMPMAPAPHETAWAAIAPLAAARLATWCERLHLPGALAAWAALEGSAWVTRPLAGEVILAHGLFPIYAPWVTRRTPLVWGPGYPVDDARRRVRSADARFRRRLARSALVFLSNSASAAALAEDFPEAEAKVRVIPIFEPHLPVDEAPPVPSIQTCDRLRVLFVGREAQRKNLAGVVHAVQALRSEGRAVELTIVSDFRDGTVATEGVATRVIAELSQREVFAALRESDVLCMPSFEETYGMVYIEAMAAGAVVIARDAPIQRALLGEHARFAVPADRTSIVASLRSLLDPDARAVLRVSAWRHYRARFAPDVVAAAFEDALRVAVAG